MTSTETGLGIEAKSDAIYELVEEGSTCPRMRASLHLIEADSVEEGRVWAAKIPAARLRLDRGAAGPERRCRDRRRIAPSG